MTPNTSTAGVVLAACLAAVNAAHAETPSAFQRSRPAKEISALPIGADPILHGESSIAVDPNDPTVVVAVFEQRRNSNCDPRPPSCPVAAGFATSHDGGRTWVTGNLPGLTLAAVEPGPFERSTQPVVAIGPDHAVYAQRLAFNRSDCRSAVAVQRSDDGGLTWGTPVLVQDDPSCAASNAKDWITVDTFPGGLHHGRVYSAWVHKETDWRVVLRHSDDRGTTWSDPIAKMSPPGFSTGPVPLVQPNGDLTIVYNMFSPLPNHLIAQTSHDGGSNFDPPVTIGTYEGVAVPGLTTGGNDVDVFPTAAVDPVTGYLYAAWQDARFRSDGQNDIVMSISTDGGSSWGLERVVNGSRPDRPFNHFTPAVAAHGGGVVLTYGRRREDEPKKVYMRRIASADDGQTFGRERGLGRRADLRFADLLTFSAGDRYLEEYRGLAATADAVHAVWSRSFRPPAGSSALQHQTTWSATILR
jgi:hypothetical protein